jgi:hypothetical protein
MSNWMRIGMAGALVLFMNLSNALAHCRHCHKCEAKPTPTVDYNGAWVGPSDHQMWTHCWRKDCSHHHHRRHHHRRHHHKK